MDGASIGGSVNLVTKSAFDRAGGRLFTFGVGFTTQPGYSGPTGKWKQPIKGFGPSANFNYQDVIGAQRNIGLTLTGLIHSQPVGGAIINNTFERRNEPGPVFNSATTRIMVNGATRSRIALGGKIDYRWNEHTTITLNTSYNFFHENYDTRSHALATVGVATAATPQLLANVDASGNRISGGFIRPGYTNTFTQVYADPLSTSVITMTSNDKSGGTYLFSPRVRHKWDTLLIDYSLSWSNSATYYDVSHNDEKYESKPKGTITYRLGNVGWTVDRSRDAIWPTITQTQGPDMNNIANYGTLLLTQTDLRGYDTVVNGKFDLKKSLSFSSLRGGPSRGGLPTSPVRA